MSDVPFEQPIPTSQRRIARQVRDDHANGGRCPECPTEPGQRRCLRMATWWPIAVQMLSEGDRVTGP